MTTFNNFDHPRGHVLNAGGFSKKANSAPEGALGAQPPIFPTDETERWVYIRDSDDGREGRAIAEYAAEHGTSEDKRAALVSGRLSAETVALLAGDDDESVRAQVASEEHTGRDHHPRLASDESELVRSYVATYASDAALLDQLANDKSSGVRDNVARNNTTSTETLHRLVAGPADRPWEGSTTGLSHPAIGGETLDALSRSANPSNRQLVASHRRAFPDTLEQLSRDKVLAVRAAVASNPATPASAMEHLSRSKVSQIGARVAMNPGAPAELLEHLADTHFGYQVAANPSAPRALLERLAAGDDRLTAEEAARHLGAR